LFEIEPLGILEGTVIAHGRRPPTALPARPAEDPPAVPLKMWLVRAGINYHNLEYKPQDAEAKYFLSQFRALYYRRNRYTIQDDFSKALYFLDGKLADGILDAYRKDDVIKKFLMNTSAPEIDIEVKKVSLEDMQSPPFKARVDFYMLYYAPADHSEMKRDLYTASFVFVFKSKVPNELIPINPLGLAITYFREDQAFK
jgi:type IV secretion system protein VirB5